MNLLILGAGYATRLYPLTENQPKPLLEVAGKPMLEHVLDALLPIEGIERIVVVTNNKFAGHFQRWADEYQKSQPHIRFTIVNDGTTTNENRLGAIGDIHFVLQKEKLEGDLIVVAGDNLFSESLEDFGRFCREKKAPVVGVYDVGSLEAAKKYNSIEVDAEGRITFFEEKMANPTSSLAAIALYYYPAEVLPEIDRYIREGNNPDQPGRLVQWLYKQRPVYAWPVPGKWYDIGSKESLAEADRVFRELKATGR
ncbi:MAG: nucleotidyltransferase family protein [Verrucomicrobia bacterium]|nr:MAG: nucleotidyltransferase family protein [Verrucomicrobiota bacterium]